MEQIERTDDKKPLWRIRPELEKLEFTSPSRAREIMDEFLGEIDSYTGSPDMWHTIAMIAGRAKHYDARLLIIQAGLQEWPNNVDLLCEQLQNYYGGASNYDPLLAKQTWERLCSLDKETVKPYWRYWVYGAIYHAIELKDSQTALNLLDEGLLYIRRDSLMDIFRSYRRILIDSIPLKQLQNQDEIKEYQAWVLNTLEEKYKLGIMLATENGYALATDLATLYQEQAGNSSQENDYLEKALSYLDLAENLYTGSGNHPIWDIYTVRIRIYMAQHRYGDALKILKSLPEQLTDNDPSLGTMKKLCGYMTGESIDENKPSTEPDLDTAIKAAIPALFQNDGEILRALIHQNPSMKSILLKVLQSE
jgi:tetratricopeptide (TPR) repeat protein